MSCEKSKKEIKNNGLEWSYLLFILFVILTLLSAAFGFLFLMLIALGKV